MWFCFGILVGLLLAWRKIKEPRWVDDIFYSARVFCENVWADIVKKL